MSVLALSGSDLVGTLIPWKDGVPTKPGLGMGLKTIPSSSTVIAANEIKLPVPLRCLFYIKLASGDLRVKLKLSAAGGVSDFATGNAVDTTVLNDTAEYAFMFSTTSALPVISAQRISASGGVVAEAGIIVLGRNGNYHELSAGLNGFGAEGGVFDLVVPADA